MKYSESWLREWVNPKLNREALSELMTNSGVEVDGILPAAEAFTGVVIGQIVNVKAHPHDENLTVCEVNVLDRNALNIVCGAPNVKKGMKVAVAKLNALLPDNSVVTTRTIKDIPSEGVLLSAKELGLSDEGTVIMALAPDAPLGENLWQYLKLDDHILDVSITPNRGDCLSMHGLAREVSAMTQAPLNQLTIPTQKPTIKDTLSVTLAADKACPHYVGRIIRDVKADAITPTIIKERLRRSGIRTISPIVDVANYVMLELGQPMHAFDLNTIDSEIIVRYAKAGEKIALLDGSNKELNEDTVVIADSNKPLAIAGVMGGMDSSVTLLTNAIFLESAYFAQDSVARSRQFYNLNSDSAYRYERGVDPALQVKAMERATQLILEICGGTAGPLIDVKSDYLPQQKEITVTQEDIKRLIGISVPDPDVERILTALQFQHRKINDRTWQVIPPSFRFDVTLVEDVIEEIARLYGYDKVPVRPIKALLRIPPKKKTLDYRLLRSMLSDLGFNEIITYSFIDPKIQQLLDPESEAYKLVNPIADDMAVMRTNLFAGLLNTMRYNVDRQQTRMQLFEIGKVFAIDNKKVTEKLNVGGLMAGLSYDEQWAIPSRNVDFYDVKGYVEMLLKPLHQKVEFKRGEHPALHPGQTAQVFVAGKPVGILGSLHPSVMQALDCKYKTLLFELNIDSIDINDKILYQNISKFPEIRRDIAIIVNETVPAEIIQATINAVAGPWLQNSFIFDVYQGKGISSGYRSIALALILQHPSRTLVDAEVAELMERIVGALKEQLGAELRS